MKEINFIVIKVFRYYVVGRLVFCVFLLGNNYYIEVKMIFKVLLCVCKYKVVRYMIIVGSEYFESERVLRR